MLFCYIISFILGTVFGSFISVLVYRIKNEEKGILLGRSKCPFCNHTLSAWDLVPIFSYLFLKGQCRYCKKQISIIYPILELVTGILFVLGTYFIFKFFPYDYVYHHIYILFYLYLIIVFIIAISFYDILFYEISFILISILGALLLLPQIIGYVGDIKQAFILGITGFLVFMAIIYLRKKIRKIDGMGGGDAIAIITVGFMLPMIVDILGLQDYPIGLSFYITILLGFISAGIVGIIYIILGKSKQFALPFLPFMFIGVLLFIIFGKTILEFIA